MSKLGLIHAEVFRDLTLDNSVQALGDTTPVLYAANIDNSANTAASYVHIWDAASPTPGTDEAQEIWRIPAGASMEMEFYPIAAAGVAVAGLTMGTAGAIACFTESKGTTSPSSSVKGSIWTDGD